MTFAEFNLSVAGAATVPPAGLSGAAVALWYDARGNWDAAHAAAQADKSKAGSWVHAYLHRKEGDSANAGYWYSLAGQRMPTDDGVTLAVEWEQIARALVSA